MDTAQTMDPITVQLSGRRTLHCAIAIALPPSASLPVLLAPTATTATAAAALKETAATAALKETAAASGWRGTM
jgi:hypothetical protein